MMLGRNTQISILVPRMVLALLLLLLTALPVGAKEGRGIAVLLSNSEQAYADAAASFEAEVGSAVRVYNLHGDIRKNPSLKKEMFDHEPELILALGAKAAYVAKIWTKERPEVKVVFAMVLNWQKYGLLKGQNNIAGIAAEIAPGTQFVNLIAFVPKVKKIGVIYSGKNSNEIISKARKKAKLLGLELVAVSIDRSGEFRSSYRKIRGQIDAFWVLNDPVTYTLENMAWIAEKCIKDRLICLGQSQNIVEEGLSFSVSANPGDIGSQAASLTRNILNANQPIKEVGVMPPLGTYILVNLKTTKRIGIQISEVALNMASKVFNK